MEVENDLGRSIIENHGVFCCSGMQKEGLIGVQSTYLDIYLCGLEVIDVNISVFFDFCIDEEFI